MNSTSKRGAKKGNSGAKNLVPIKKGQVLNPTGRPKLPEDILQMKRASTEQLISAYYKFAFTEIKELNNEKPVNLIEQGVRQTISNFANTGEITDISKLWDRVLGKPMESIDITSKGESLTNDKLTPEERRAMIDRLRSEMGNNNA
jgi:hypothetical protein